MVAQCAVPRALGRQMKRRCVKVGDPKVRDLDMQSQLALVIPRSSPRAVVVWIRGHPERRQKNRGRWDRHERGIFEVGLCSSYGGLVYR